MQSPICLKMTNKELFYFTGKCLMLDEDPGFRKEIIRKIDAGDIDWQKFVALCNHHLILPVIYLKFKSHDLIAQLPDELSDFLKEIYDLNVTRNNEIIQQLHEVTELLNQNNIDPLFLKGSGNLLDELYATIGERILTDIDILVPEKDYLLSAKLLEDDGYTMPEPFYGDVENQKHYPLIWKPGYPAVLEIHRLPVTEKHQRWFNSRIVDGEKKQVAALNGCFVLSDQHKIILNFIHSQLDHKNQLYGVVSFRDLYDLYLLSKRVDLKKTLPHIKNKQRAISYFAFAGKAFRLDAAFYEGNNIAYRLFCTIHDLNLRSRVFYHLYRTIVYFSQRIFVGYIGQFIQSFYSKKVRLSVFDRITNRHWYGAHFRSYLSFINPKKEA